MSDGWNTPERVITTPAMAESEFNKKPNHGIGLVHSVSHTCAIDVDDLECFTLILDEFGLDITELFMGAPRIVGRPGRDKAIFRLPADVVLSRKALNWPGKPGGDGKPITVVEFRAGDVQDVLPPTIHPDTHQPYRWMEGTDPALTETPFLPRELLYLWQHWDEFKDQLKAICPWAPKSTATPKANPARSTGHDGSDFIGQFNRANDLASLLTQYGYIPRGKRFMSPTSKSKLAGMVILEDGTHCYSHHASDPMADGYAHDAFDLFCHFEHGGDFDRAIRACAQIFKPATLPSVDVSGLLARRNGAQPVAACAAGESTQPGAIPSLLLTIPGALGELVAHNIASAIKPQRVLAVSAALAFGATMMARMYETKTGLRSNIYLLGIAPTAYGKEHARNINKDALVACGMKQRIGGEEIKSGAALLARAQIEPCSLFQLDEFGLTLQSVMSANANGYQAEIMHNFMKLYSSSSTIMAGPEYADQRLKPRVDIEYPNISLYGTSTAETIWPALRSSHVLSGFLNRFIFTHSESSAMPVDETPAKHRTDIPESFLLWCKAILSTDGLAARGNMVGVSPSSPYTVQETAGAANLLKDFSKFCNKQMDALQGTGLDGLWGRANAYALKVAMIVAGSIDPKPPVITEHAAEWAITFVRYWTERLVEDVRLRMVDDEFSAKCDSVLRILEKCGEAGASLREISKRWRGWRSLKPREQEEVLDALVRTGDAVHGQRKGGRGPACSVYVARKFAPEATVSDVDE